MSLLKVSNIVKKHGDSIVVDDVSFVQERLQKVAIAGETGSGKTTLMRIIAGLGQANSGKILFEDTAVKGIDEKLMAGHKGIAYLSQHFELNNNYRVEEVLTYANDLTNEESDHLYKVCRIDHLLHRWTNTLSGGEKQRVALAKLLTHKPRLLLLDEPFSNMDLIHKNLLKTVIDDIGDRLSITCMLISHSPEDILSWADMVLVMKEGKVIESGTPKEIYSEPRSAYTAGLFGKFTISAKTGKYIRPEQVMLVGAHEGGIEGVVRRAVYLGSHYEIEIEVRKQTIIAQSHAAAKAGDNIFLKIAERN